MLAAQVELVIKGVDALSLVGPKDWDSFKRVEAYLQQDITFSELEGLKGKFKGIKPKKADYRGEKSAVKKSKLAAKKLTRSQRNVIKVSTKMLLWAIQFLFPKKVAPKDDD